MKETTPNTPGNGSTPVQSKAQAQLALSQLTTDQLEEAQGEIDRELLVRERCYPRWVAEGKVSKMDAKDRLYRQKMAREILQMLIDSMQDIA